MKEGEEMLSVSKSEPQAECFKTKNMDPDTEILKDRVRGCMKKYLWNSIQNSEMEMATLENFEYNYDKNFTIRQVTEIEEKLCHKSNDCMAIDIKFIVKIDLSTSKIIKLRKRDNIKNGFTKFANFFRGGQNKHKVRKPKILMKKFSTNSQGAEQTNSPQQDSYAKAVVILSWTTGKMRIEIMDNIK